MIPELRVTLHGAATGRIQWHNNNNHNNHNNVYGAVITAEPLQEFTRFI